MRKIFLFFILSLLSATSLTQTSYELSMGTDLPMYQVRIPYNNYELKEFNRFNFRFYAGYNFLESKLIHVKAGFQYAFSSHNIHILTRSDMWDGEYELYDRDIHDQFHFFQFNLALMEKGIHYKRITLKPIGGVNFGILTLNKYTENRNEYSSSSGKSSNQMYFEKGLYRDFYLEVFGGLRTETTIFKKLTLTGNLLCSQNFRYSDYYVSKKNFKLELGLKKQIDKPMDTTQARQSKLAGISYQKTYHELLNDESSSGYSYTTGFDSEKTHLLKNTFSTFIHWTKNRFVLRASLAYSKTDFTFKGSAHYFFIDKFQTGYDKSTDDKYYSYRSTTHNGTLSFGGGVKILRPEQKFNFTPMAELRCQLFTIHKIYTDSLTRVYVTDTDYPNQQPVYEVDITYGKASDELKVNPYVDAMKVTLGVLMEFKLREFLVVGIYPKRQFFSSGFFNIDNAYEKHPYSIEFTLGYQF